MDNIELIWSNSYLEEMPLGALAHSDPCSMKIKEGILTLHKNKTYTLKVTRMPDGWEWESWLENLEELAFPECLTATQFLN